MPSPLFVFSGVSSRPEQIRVPGDTPVTFSIRVSDLSALLDKPNPRKLTLKVDAEGVAFENGKPSVEDEKAIAVTPTDVELPHTITVTTSQTSHGVNVSLFDETGLLGQVLLRQG